MNKEKITKILKIVAIVLAVFLVMFLVHWVKNYFIISSLQDKVAKKMESKNYHAHSVATESENTTLTIDYYKKDDREATFIENNKDGKIVKMSFYNNGHRTDMFIDSEEEKVAKIDVNALIPGMIINVLQADSKWQTFLYSAGTSITSTKYEGKSCYKIKNFLSPYVLEGYDNKTEYIIEKDTGLVIKHNVNDIVTEREYEFDNVDVYIFAEPDIGNYTIKKDE